MRSHFRLRQRLPQTAACALWLLLGGWGLAQVPAPGDGILDETRALSPDIRRQVSDELRLFRQDLKCDAWITASSFTQAGTSVRRQAQITRHAWSGDRPAVLMAYDRATQSSGMSFSPALWQRYSSAELVEIMQESSRILADATLALEERIALATRGWTERLRAMERVRLKQSLLIQREEKPLALVTAISLGGLALIAAVFGLLSRRRDASAEHRFHFPDVHVGMRFGAPYGGGVGAELKPNMTAS